MVVVEPAGIPEADAQELLEERARAEARAQELGAEEAAAAVEAELVEDERPTTPEELKAPVFMLNTLLRRMQLEPLSEEESKEWREACAPVLNKYGGRIPFAEELTLIAVTGTIAAPRVRAWWQRRQDGLTDEDVRGGRDDEEQDDLLPHERRRAA